MSGRRLAVLSVYCASVAWLPLVWMRLGPLPAGLLDLQRHASAEIVDRNGQPLYEVLSVMGARQRTIGSAELPDNLVRTTLAAEDERFFAHAGVDPLALVRAAIHNLRARRLREGGSTITQQVAKLLIDRPRTLRGKVRELVIALRLEHRLDKREILALYLTLAPYGNQLVGARAASQAYFGCPPENLTLAQAALLAALPQRPSALNPQRNLEGALDRQRWVLARLGELGLAGEAEPRGPWRARNACRCCAGTATCWRRTSWSASRKGCPPARDAWRRRWTASCRRRCAASCARTASGSKSTGRTTWPWPCSTTRAASGWPGKAPATTSMRNTAAPSTAW
jgi:hypothetical protein